MELELPDYVLDTLNTLNEAGYAAYVVGGAVRSLLLKEEPKDYDICTNALPDEVEKLFDKTIPTGKKYGTITVINDGFLIEVTTFRYDSPVTDGRRPEYVTFGKTLKDDVDRRDFTINSLAYNPLTGIIDYKDGLNDIYNHIIRCVGDPTTRFKEDGLRVLRAIRFAVRYKFRIDKDTLDAMYNLTIKENVLSRISQERIHDELVKILSYDFSFLPYIEFEKITSILNYILDVDTQAHFTRNILDRQCLYIEKLSYFYKCEDVSLVEPKLRDLKFTNDEIKLIVNSIKAYQYLAFTYFKKDDNVIFKAKMSAYRYGEDATINARNILIYDSSIDEHVSSLFLHSLVEPHTLNKLAIKGDDIKKIFKVEGKAVKQYLESALFYIFEDPERNKKERLINYLKGLYGDVKCN